MPPGLIKAVTPGSLGARLGIRSGDHLVSINGVAVRDVIDVQVLAAEERLVLTVLRPEITLGKTVNPNGTQPPGTDLTYTVDVTNAGTDDAVDLVAVDSLPPEVQFKVGTVADSLPAGVTVTVEYSDDGGSTWTYTPVSEGCSAPAGYDGCVTHIRWTFNANLGAVAPDNRGTLEYVARIR